MRVFVFNMRGKPLMPCSKRKARILLKENKAIIKKYNPFTIQLTYATGESKQKCHIGVSAGSKHIGIAIVSNENVLFKSEVELRQDVSKNLTTRRIYRKSRRNRKTRYRKPRFLNRKKNSGWLPPSIQNRVNHHFRWINTFMLLIPNPTLHIEIAKFDMAKMINPDIGGIDYQRGQTFGYYNVRYYVFARDNYTCQVCKKSKDKILRTHHIIYKSNGGTDRADNLITVCNDCHTSENHKEGGILYKWQEEHKKVEQYKNPLFLNILRKRFFENYPNAEFIYGADVTPKRKELGLKKTHYNDAIAACGIHGIREDSTEWMFIRQTRKKKRSLHEATARKGRKNPNYTAKRNKKNTPYYKGFFLNDKVSVYGQNGYITGFAEGGAYVKDDDGNYITKPGKKYKQVTIGSISCICHNNNWQYIRKTA